MAQVARLEPGGDIIEVDLDPSFSDAVSDAYLYAKVRFASSALPDMSVNFTSSLPCLVQFDGFCFTIERVGSDFFWWSDGVDYAGPILFDQWIELEIHAVTGVTSYDVMIDGTLYPGISSGGGPATGVNYWLAGPLPVSIVGDNGGTTADDVIFVDDLAWSTTNWVSIAGPDVIWDFETADPLNEAIANYPTPPFYYFPSGDANITVSAAPAPPPASPSVTVFIDGSEVTDCVRSGAVTRRLNRPWQASVQLYSECAIGDACSRMKVYIGATLWFHGFVTQISTEAGEDGALISEYTALDPMMLWQWRPARDGPDSLDPGDFSNPAFFTEFKFGPQILEQLLLQSEDDSDPADGEGPLFIDLAGATYATGVTSLRGAPTDWPMTIAECFELMSSTGVLDAILTPIDTGGNMASLAVYNGDYGTDRTATVFFDYATGNHNVRTVRMTEDSTNLVNKLWYYLGPRVQTARDPAGDQHWRANITGTHASFNPNVSPQGGWTGATSYSLLDTVTNTVDGDSITFVALQTHTSAAVNEPGIGAQWGRFWAFHIAPPGGRSVDGTNTPAGPPWTDNQLGERIYNSRIGGCGVRMDIRIYDAQGDENPSQFRELYERLWQEESWLRAIPRTLIHVTPIRQSDNMQLPPGVSPVAVGAFDIGDLVTVSAGSIVRGGFTGAQRIYEYTVSWDEDGILEVGELMTSADQEGLQ